MSIVKSKDDDKDEKSRYALSKSKASAKIVADVIARFFSLVQIEFK